MPRWQQVADQFLEFFREHGHTVVPSSSLIPGNDPTLLFTNAGMVQFKETFLGQERRAYARAVSLQKCMRVQGKHNDLENVGPSPRHQTFFLMLGNFSFGDYFKDDAVAYAWELVTGTYGIDAGRLIITVLDQDEEAARAWRRVGVPDARILRMGEETNFWMMGEVGPCGPNSELHYDWGPQACTCRAPDCSVALDNGCMRWLEIWNLVFMQYDQQPGGARVRLPSPGVDTGMGLERIVSVLQGVNDDYGTDLFTPVLNRVHELAGYAGAALPQMVQGAARESNRVAYRVMADHARAMTFLMGDGVVPGNEGRGYVLRMIMRRAMRFGRAAGLSGPFLRDLAAVVIAEMGGAYPDLRRQQSFILEAARAEEERFAQTLSGGLGRLEEVIADVGRRGVPVIAGEEVFRLYDTYGFPLEMTRDVAHERGLQIDEEGFARAMDAQRERARAAQTFAARDGGQPYAALAGEGVTCEFLGYRALQARGKVVALFVDGRRVDDAREGDQVDVVLDRTPFYAESGGQVGDTGRLRASKTEVAIADTQRPTGQVIVHRGTVTRGRLRVGQPLRAEVDAPRRTDIMRNHTATHLLHQALQEVLGGHARQSGSLVAPDRLRFDFVHLSPLTPDQREVIEQRVNAKIFDDLPVRARWMSYGDAVAAGATALFGEKYGDRVRVIGIDGYSRELCGGTHLTRTAQIGLFKITGEGGVAAGVRRIEAVTGRGAYALMRRQETALRSMAETLRAGPDEVPERVRRLAERVKELERQARSGPARSGAAGAIASRALEDAVEINGVRFVFETVDAAGPEALRAATDRVRDVLHARGQRGVIVLGSDATGQVVASRTRDAAIDVGRFIKNLAAEFGGSGGGRADFAQGGLKDARRVRELVEQGRRREFVEAQLTRLA